MWELLRLFPRKDFSVRACVSRSLNPLFIDSKAGGGGGLFVRVAVCVAPLQNPAFPLKRKSNPSSTPRLHPPAFQPSKPCTSHTYHLLFRPSSSCFPSRIPSPSPSPFPLRPRPLAPLTLQLSTSALISATTTSLPLSAPSPLSP